jgi:mRNA-degrading endonuclease RelE of RelBE toxin-antitoxin system
MNCRAGFFDAGVVGVECEVPRPSSRIAKLRRPTFYTCFAYNKTMLFIESSLFTQQLSDYLSDDSYAEFQAFLCRQPDAGAIIRGSGGLRKMRWRASGRGKRGGLRMIYYWRADRDRIYCLTLYAKNEMADLSAPEIRLLRDLMERWLHEKT